MSPTLARRDWIVAAIGAGIVAAVTLALFAYIADARAALGPGVTYEFLASAVVGPQALGQTWSIPLGVAVLLAGTIFWGFGYVYAAQKQEQLVRRPLISGVIFGVLVWFIMQVVLVGVGKFEKITIYSFDRDMVAFILFFGIPLALTASRLTRRK